MNERVCQCSGSWVRQGMALEMFVILLMSKSVISNYRKSIYGPMMTEYKELGIKVHLILCTSGLMSTF